MTQQIKQVKSKFPTMILFAVFFMVCGWFAPYTYYRYVDKKVHFKYNSVETNKNEYKLCENISLHINRFSDITTSGELVLQLFEKDDHRIVHQHIEIKVPISAGSKEFDDESIKLPCDNLRNSTYFYEGALNYKVDRVIKTATFVTNDFKITK